MIRRTSVAIATLALLAACGSSGRQGEVADMLMADAETANMKLDRSCVDDVANQLSDDDAAKLLDSDDVDVEISAEGEALAGELFDCIDTDDLIEQVVADLPDEGIDKDCVRDELEKIDFQNLGDDSLDGVGDVMLECVDVGG